MENMISPKKNDIVRVTFYDPSKLDEIKVVINEDSPLDSMLRYLEKCKNAASGYYYTYGHWVHVFQHPYVGYDLSNKDVVINKNHIRNIEILKGD